MGVATLLEKDFMKKLGLQMLSPEEAKKNFLESAHLPTTYFDMGKALTPKPEFAGLRMAKTNKPGEPYFLISPEGYRHWIPDPYTYNRLFRSWEGVTYDLKVLDLPLGPSLSVGASIIRGDHFSAVYLVTNGIKRWIMSPAVMDYCWFKWPEQAHGDVVGAAVVEAIREGAHWMAPIL